MHISGRRIVPAGVFIFVPMFLIATITIGETKGTTMDDASNIEDVTETTLFFVGDMMLGRGVESLMLEQGAGYPFFGMDSLIQQADLAVANFEGSVPRIHRQTKPYTLTFSIRDEYLRSVKSAGFDLLSLANNHSYDYGNAGLSHTRERCDVHGILCSGDPFSLNAFSTYLYEGEYHTVGFVFLNTIFREQDLKEFSSEIKDLELKSDVIIVFVHWGDEYELVQSNRQKTLAHYAIDAGADAVIGHHPHVVQGIERYRDGLIFYSLGNFIFDQYFSKEVQQGIAVSLTIDAHTKQFEVIPFTSLHTRSQPQEMMAEERDELFERVFDTTEHEDGRMSMYLF